MLTGNPQQASSVRLSPAGRRNDLIAQQRARVGKAALGIADRWIGRHRSLPSVILFEIDVECIAVLELRRRRPAPTSPHTNIPPAAWFGLFQQTWWGRGGWGGVGSRRGLF